MRACFFVFILIFFSVLSADFGDAVSCTRRIFVYVVISRQPPTPRWELDCLGRSLGKCQMKISQFFINFVFFFFIFYLSTSHSPRIRIWRWSVKGTRPLLPFVLLVFFSWKFLNTFAQCFSHSELVSLPTIIALLAVLIYWRAAVLRLKTGTTAIEASHHH